MQDQNIILNELKLLIQNLYKGKEIIALHEPSFDKSEIKFLEKCIKSGFVSSVGQYVTQFEQEMAKFLDAKYAIAVSNGTAALHASLVLLGANSDTEVITQSLTFVATANAISYTGATPIFLDSDEDNLGLGREALERYLKTYIRISRKGLPFNKDTKKTVACCIPMHVFGHAVHMKEIQKLCNQYNIPILEDAAEALGSTYQKKKLGTIGKLGVLSFNGNKIITTGGGGMIITNDEKLAKKAKHITTTAKVPHPWEFFHDQVAYNYRMPNLNAALGVAQLGKLEKFLKSKKEIASKYHSFCKKHDLKFITPPKDSTSNHWLNAIILDSKKEKNFFLQEMNKHQIHIRPCWELMTSLPMYKNAYKDDLINANFFVDRVINLPSSSI